MLNLSISHPERKPTRVGYILILDLSISPVKSLPRLRLPAATRPAHDPVANLG